MDGDEADMGDVEGIDSFTKVRRRLMRLDDWKRLTVLTPSRIAVRTSAQTFFPSSHFDTADENRYDSRRPVTVQAASQCSVNLRASPMLRTPTTAAPALPVASRLIHPRLLA